MNGFNVTYTKNGNSVKIFAPTEKTAKALMVEALRDDECNNIGVKPA